MNVVVLADTHAPRRWRGVPANVADHLEGADLILHAGDVCTVDVLEELSAYAPVRAVRGNNDGPDIAVWGAPVKLVMDLDGLAVGMLPGKALRMRDKPPIGLAAVMEGFRVFNPGSCQ